MEQRKRRRRRNLEPKFHVLPPRLINGAEARHYVGGKVILKRLQDMGLVPVTSGHKNVRYDVRDLDLYIDALKGGWGDRRQKQ